MTPRKDKTKTRNILYVPPHARKKVNADSELDSQPQLPIKKIKLCEDSNKIFEKAAEIEERNKRYCDDYFRKIEALKPSEEDSLFEGEGSLCNNGDRPETCAVTVKRLVSQALGVKAAFSDSELVDLAKIASARDMKKQSLIQSSSKDCNSFKTT